MPRKKLSPNNRSTEDESNSEESDSSMELNSRRNTYRKKPQRKLSLKHSQNTSPESTEVRQREKFQGSTLEKNVKRPSIIKIFRRIGRRAKNIYLVDDKIEDGNEFVKSAVSKRKKSPHSFVSTGDKRSLFNRYAPRMHIRKVKTNYGMIDLKKVNIHNQLGDRDASPSVTDIAETTGKVEVWNRPRDIEVLYPSKTDIERSPIRVDVCSQRLSDDTNSSNSSETDIDQTHSKACVLIIPRDTYGLYSPVTGIDEKSNKEYIQNQPCDTNDLHSPVTGIDEKSDKEYIQNQPCDTNDLYSPVTDVVKTPVTDNIWNQPRDTEALYPSETDSDQTPMRADICNQHLNRDFDVPNSPEADIGQTPKRSNTWSQHLNSGLNAPNSSESDVAQTPSRSEAWSQYLNSSVDAPNFSESDTAQTPNKSDDWSQHLDSDLVEPKSWESDVGPSISDVFHQYLNREFDAPDSLVNAIEQIFGNSHSFDLLNSDLDISSDDDLPSSEYSHFNFHPNQNLDVTYYPMSDVHHILNETADKTYRQSLSSDPIFSKTVSDVRVNKADEVPVSRERIERVFTMLDSHEPVSRKERKNVKIIRQNDGVGIIETVVTNTKVKMKYILK